MFGMFRLRGIIRFLRRFEEDDFDDESFDKVEDCCSCCFSSDSVIAASSRVLLAFGAGRGPVPSVFFAGTFEPGRGLKGNQL